MIQIIFELRIDKKDSKLIWKVRFKINLKSKVQNLFEAKWLLMKKKKIEICRSAMRCSRLKTEFCSHAFFSHFRCFPKRIRGRFENLWFLSRRSMPDSNLDFALLQKQNYKRRCENRLLCHDYYYLKVPFVFGFLHTIS